MPTFADLGLSDQTLDTLSKVGYETPTPIQEKAIPILLMERDVLGCAQTGTGKTASFILPMVEILASGKAKAKMPRSIVLAPTRELAMQVAENFDQYTLNQTLSMALLIGGVQMGEQAKQLAKGVDVLIATPGRLMDFLDRGDILTTDVKMLVIDEADRMLDMGFIPDIEKIVGFMPPLRQTVMFSATMPKEIRKLADQFLMNPKEIYVAPPATTAQTVTQYVCRNVSPKGKIDVLEKLLDTQDVENGIIFCNRKSEVSTLCKMLLADGYSVGSLHGDMNQHQRIKILQDFKDNKIKILVCSDVAARGLDIPTVSHVFNYDLPNHPEDYVHRIGRTGRAGRTGTAFALVTARDGKLLDAIEKNIKSSIKEFSFSTPKVAKNSKSNEPSKYQNKKDNPKKQKSKRSNKYNNYQDEELYIESLPNIDGTFADSNQVPNFLRVSIYDTPKKSTSKKAASKKSASKKAGLKKSTGKTSSVKKASAKKTATKKATPKPTTSTQ